jgi:site-specific DNA recombinase
MEKTEESKAAIYARSACNGDGHSTEDQIRACRAFADRKGLCVNDAHIYSDAGTSGATITDRAGLKCLLAAGQGIPQPFAAVLMSEPSRLGRDMAVVLPVLDLLKSLNVSISFVNLELDSSAAGFRDLLLIPFMQDRLYLDNLSHAVRRGQAGRVADGLIPGGRCLGYDHVCVADPTWVGRGRPRVMGVKLVINQAEAALIRRIFDLRGTGLSYRRIANQLNDEQGTFKWTAGRICAIVNNKRYLGIIPFSHTRRIRHPESGKTLVKHLPPAEWLDYKAPELRIIPDELWRKVHGIGDEGEPTR